jgi:hypothetical protein
MPGNVSHDRSEETPEAKARWFESLTLAERMDRLCAVMDLAPAANAHLPTSRRLNRLNEVGLG